MPTAKSMEPIPSCETFLVPLVIREYFASCGTLKGNSFSRRSRHRRITRSRQIQFTSSLPVSLRSILILPFLYCASLKTFVPFRISGNIFYADNWALLGFYAASSADSLPTFRDDLSVPSSRVILEKGRIGFPETSVRSHPYLLCNSPEERSSQLLPDGSLKPLIFHVSPPTLYHTCCDPR